MAFKNSIKEIRLNNRLSKVEMARKLDVSEGTIRMWESGRTEPRMGMVEKISSLFNVSKGYLLEKLKKLFYQNLIAKSRFHISVKFLLEISRKLQLIMKN